jgi:hypothetical protein
MGKKYELALVRLGQYEEQQRKVGRRGKGGLGSLSPR